MRIDVTQHIKDYKGEDIKTSEDSNLELRDVISTAINTLPTQKEKQMTTEQKNKAYQISIKIWSDKIVDFTVDDRKFIKDKVGEVYTPLIYGRVSDIFEEKDSDDKDQKGSVKG